LKVVTSFFHLHLENPYSMVPVLAPVAFADGEPAEAEVLE
jgi:hypothetical protein